MNISILNILLKMPMVCITPSESVVTREHHVAYIDIHDNIISETAMEKHTLHLDFEKHTLHLDFEKERYSGHVYQYFPQYGVARGASTVTRRQSFCPACRGTGYIAFDRQRATCCTCKGLGSVSVPTATCVVNIG